MFEGIESTGIEDQTTSPGIVPVVSDPLEQTQPRVAVVNDANEDTAKRSALKASPSVLTPHLAQTSLFANAEEHLSSINHTLLTPPLGQAFDPSTALVDVSTLETFVDPLSPSPEYSPLEHNLIAHASAANDQTIMNASVHAKPLTTGSAKSFLKRRGIGMVIVCLVAVCIFAVAFLAFSISGPAQGHKTVPTAEPLFSTPASTVVSPTTPSLSSTPTPGVTTVPQQAPAVTPSPVSTPTVPVQPTSIPTSPPSPEPTSTPQPNPTPAPTRIPCLLIC